MSPSARLTLIRPDNASVPAAPRVVAAATPMPLTAGSELRVSGDVRRVSWDMAEEHRSLEQVEALCSVEQPGRPAETRPGVVLLDHRFPIWLAVFDDEAFISIDTELLKGAARQRFQAASRYVQFLAARGYSSVFDHELQRIRELLPDGPGIVDWLARAGSSRVFDRLRTNRRIGFVTGFVGFLIADVALRPSTGVGRPVWLTLLNGLCLGSGLTALQYSQARKALVERLEQLRAEVLSGTGPAERLTFRRPRYAIWGEILGVVLFGVFGTIAWIEEMWVVGFFLSSLFVAAAASLLLAHHTHVQLDGGAVNGWSAAGRIRLRYVDINRIVEYRFPELTTISSVTGTIWVPGSLTHYRQLVDVLWQRVERAVAENRDAVLVTLEAAESLRALLQRSRQQVRFPLDAFAAARQPLWLFVFARNYPLRKQFPWHPHLLRRGRLAFGLVIDADPALAQAQRDDDAHDGFAVVLLGPDLPVEIVVDVLDSVAERVLRGLDDRAVGEDVSPEIESFTHHLHDCWPFPMLVEVPRQLTDGYLIYCTSVLVVLRDAPLGRLRAPWIPVLIDPQTCPHVMILPMRYWPEAWRRQWMATPRAASSPALDSADDSF